MAVIGELAVNIVAKTDKLTKGLTSARKQVAGLSKGFTAATRGISNFTKVALGIGGGLGVIGVAASMRSAADAIDRLAKSSQKLGISTEALAGLHVAAERTGVQVNQLEMGLQRMVRRVAEAAQGTGEAQAAIAELGLDARRLNVLAPDQKFAAIAEAMKGVGGQADNVRLAFKLFDSGGVGLIRTMDLGSKGLKEMREEAERLGLAVSKEEAAKIEQFNDQLGRLQGLSGGIGRDIVIRFAPGVMKTLEGIEALLAPQKNPNIAGGDQGEAKGIIKRNTLKSYYSVAIPAAELEMQRAVAHRNKYRDPFYGSNLNATSLRRVNRARHGLQQLRADQERQLGSGRLGEGVALRPGEVMNPKQARELVTINQQQLREERALNQKMADMIEELRKTYGKEVDPFDITPVTIP
jgi:hypothetical protein